MIINRKCYLRFALMSILAWAWATAVFAASSLDLGPKTSIRAISVSPDGKILAAITVKRVVVRSEENEGTLEGFRFDSSLQLWSMPQRKLMRTFVKSEDDPHSIAFSPDSRILACGTQSGGVQLWDVNKGKRIWTFWDVGGPDTPLSVAFAPDGKRLVTGWASETLENWGRMVFWNVKTSNPSEMTRTQQLVTGGKCNIQSVAYSPDGKTVVSGSWGYSRIVSKGASVPHLYYGELRFVNARTGKMIRLIKTKSEGINTVVFSPNGKLLATTSITHYGNVVVRVREAKSGALLHTLTLDEPGTAVATFLSDSATLAVGKQNGSVTLWDAQKNKVKKSFLVHKSQINAMAFVASSNNLIIGSKDGVLKMLKLKV